MQSIAAPATASRMLPTPLRPTTEKSVSYPHLADFSGHDRVDFRSDDGIDLLGQKSFRLLPGETGVIFRPRQRLDRCAIDAEERIGGDAVEEIFLMFAGAISE